MQKDLVLQGKFKIYFHLMAYLSIFWGGLTAVLFFVNRKSCYIAAAFLAVYLVINIIVYKALLRKLTNELIEFAMQYSAVDKNILDGFIVPNALLDNDGNIIWVSETFAKAVDVTKDYSKNISSVFPEITKKSLPNHKAEMVECNLIYVDRYYRVVMQTVDISALSAGQKVVKVNKNDSIISLYMFDETRMHELEETSEGNELVVGYINIDNFDEAIENLEDVRQSLLMALIDRKINHFLKGYDAVFRKYEKDKYIYTMRKSSYEAMRKARFPLLSDVKSVDIGNDMAITVSMTAAFNQESYAKASEVAMSAMGLALGRGGDQAVVKDGDKTTFYGGKTESFEKATHVKARVKAQALREYILSHDKVLIMGHKITDVDTLGAAIGIYNAARALERPGHILVDTRSASVAPMLESLKNNLKLEPNMFISAEEALTIVNNDSLVIVVDTNRPSYTECEELLKKSDAIVVFDHHRQGEEYIEGAVLSYVEPYASSACEMVAEILQYFDENIKLSSREADIMYAGILVDTNSFQTRTGVRTFEAAAFLKRKGADITRVRKMFRESIEDYRIKAKAISNSELLLKHFAITECSGESDRPTILGAQVANELLDVVGVQASFVLTKYGNKVYISARAIDEVNVQLIMERLGGGGHLNIAGAQFEDLEVEEVKTILKNVIRQMTEEGDI